MQLLSQIRQTAAGLRQLFASDSVRLEVSSKCQLKCPVCPTAKGINREGAVGWGNLTLESFEGFVQHNPHIRYIEISNWGEVLLNPELKEIIRRAYESGIELAANNGVNFNSASDDTLEAMVKYRFRNLTVAIDGAAAESYREYRKGGDFNRVIANIEKLNAYKKQYRSRYPILTWQFIVFGHNEHEVDQAKSMARSLGMNFSIKLNGERWGPQYSPVKDRDAVRLLNGIGVANMSEFAQKYGHEYLTPCQDMWLLPQINWDGKLLGCCANIWGDFGNVFESGLDACMASEKYVYTQRMLLGEVPAREDSPCVQCHLYQKNALSKLLDSSWSPQLARKVLSSRIADRNRAHLSASERIENSLFDGAREASAYARRLRGWMNRKMGRHSTT